MLTVGSGAEAEKTLAERLGHAPDARLLMIHADDLGMCHSVNAASTRAMTEGVVSSASVMVPCPWFPEMAEWARAHPTADLGLHLTLTSEWRVYRWRPVAPITQVKGLLDPDGYMWRGVEDVVKHASPEEVEIEIRAQVERAFQFGMKPTHVDSHMGTLFADPKFFEVYVRVAREVDVMPMIPGPTPEILVRARAGGLDYLKITRDLNDRGYVVLDLLNTSVEGSDYATRKAAFHQFIRTLKPGVTELIVHLSGDEEEIRHISGSWQNRYNELRITTDADTKALVEAEKVKLVGYRDLAKLWTAGKRSR
jgi:predicted glycoside hydrolase/deacetylase ChbG (UPF0249 family)